MRRVSESKRESESIKTVKRSAVGRESPIFLPFPHKNKLVKLETSFTEKGKGKRWREMKEEKGE